MPSDHALQRAYERLAKTYDANRDQFDIEPVLDGFLERLPRHGHLLDLGCGAGEPVARTFVERGWQVTGVDFCASMLDLAARYVPDMRRVQGDMREVGFAAGSFDAVTAVYSLFHLPWREHPDLFARMHEWLRPGGRVLMTYATRAYTGADRFEGHKAFMGESLFYSHATPAELVEQLEEAGFEVEDQRDHLIGGETFMWVSARRGDRA